MAAENPVASRSPARTVVPKGEELLAIAWVFGLTIVRLVAETGGPVKGSAAITLQIMPLPVVARIRAEPLSTMPGFRALSMAKPTMSWVPNKAVPPAPNTREVVDALFSDAPPAGPKTSTPTRIGLDVALLQAKTVARPLL